MALSGRRSMSLFILAVVLLTFDAKATDAQEQWKWPETPKNMTVLEGLSGQKLQPVMTGFTRALGVRCTYCHVGEEGKDLTTYDFASDANPNKERSREMLRMLGSINEHLRKIEPSKATRVNMWCHMCHQGRPRPTTLEEEMNEAYAGGGAAAAVTRYRELRERFYGKAGLDFSERPLNLFGYELLGKKDHDGAIAIFRLNASQFPASGKAWGSLAEAYLAAGKRQQAEIYYRKAVELDPQNENALKKLLEIDGKTPLKDPALPKGG